MDIALFIPCFWPCAFAFVNIHVKDHLTVADLLFVEKIKMGDR